jgi:hypothetical protein
MTKMKATEHMTGLNKVLNGCEVILMAIEGQKTINTDKTFKALCISQKILAHTLKAMIIDRMSEGLAGKKDVGDLFSGIFKE